MSNSTNTGRREQGGGRGEEEGKKIGVFCFFFWAGFDGGSKESITLMVT
jgi:hypothetical protein